MWLVLLFISLIPHFVLAQTHKECFALLKSHGFISDGQDHQAQIKNNRYTKLYVVFYPQFQYRIVICCDNKYTPIEFNLKDNNGNSLFSNLNKDYIRTWDFQFSSIMNAVIELKLSKEYVKEENTHIMIGYKSIKRPN